MIKLLVEILYFLNYIPLAIEVVLLLHGRKTNAPNNKQLHIIEFILEVNKHFLTYYSLYKKLVS